MPLYGSSYYQQQQHSSVVSDLFHHEDASRAPPPRYSQAQQYTVAGTSSVPSPAAAHPPTPMCPMHHPLSLGTHCDNPQAVRYGWNCDVCRASKLNASSVHLMCRQCNFDVCTLCAPVPVTPSSLPALPPAVPAPVSTSEQRPSTAPPSCQLVCPNKHPLSETSVAVRWNCDVCKKTYPPQASFNCRRCDFDVCPACAIQSDMSTPSSAPQASQGALSLSCGNGLASSGKKLKSVFIGCNYSGTSHALSGCINDVRVVRALLQSLNYDISEARVLVDDAASSGLQPSLLHGRPTKQEILTAMDWLVSGAKPGDSLFFHFSGHGSQAADQDGDEADGFDETLVPLDFEHAGHIRDDDIFLRMVSRVPAGCRLTGLVDCCHSGSIFDLPLIYRPDAAHNNGTNSVAKRVRSKGFCEDGGVQKQTRGDVLLISGCKDTQTSADVSNATQFLSNRQHTENSGIFLAASQGGGRRKTGGGACTLSFVEALRSGGYGRKTYKDVQSAMYDALRRRQCDQVPQFSSSKTFEFGSLFSFTDTLV